MKHLALILLSVHFLLTACVTTSWDWVQDGKTDADFRIDSGECTAQSREDRQTYIPEDRTRSAGQNLMMESRWESVVNQEMYGTCMRERGWQAIAKS